MNDTKVYYIVNIQIHDAETYRKYEKGFFPILKKYDGEFITFDDTPEKIGKFVPGTGFEIVSRNRLKRSSIKNIIILAHNFKDYIRDSLIQDSNYEGRIYIMIPEITEL